MRSLEQRIAEIDRRSNEIFKKRKKMRRHLLTACVPVVLCAGLCFLLIPPSTVPLDSISPPAATDSLYGNKSHSSLIISTIPQIEISCNGQSRICSDPAVIQNINALLISYTTDSERGTVGASGTHNQSAVYTITLTRSDGTFSRYRLENTTLTEEVSNQVYYLTQAQAEDLLRVLSFDS